MSSGLPKRGEGGIERDRRGVGPGAAEQVAAGEVDVEIAHRLLEQMLELGGDHPRDRRAGIEALDQQHSQPAADLVQRADRALHHRKPPGDQVVVGAVLADLIERVLGREQPVGVGRELAEALRHLAGADLDLRLAGAGLGVQQQLGDALVLGEVADAGQHRLPP